MKRISLFEPNMMGGLDDPRLQTPMFFVGIQREVAPPVFFGRNRLQRMRVIVIEPEQASDPGVADSGEPAFEVLPRLPAPPHHLALQPRPVHGEILRGENDELYERVGNRIRRLRNLAAGPNGEILDVAHAGPPAPPQRARMQPEEAPQIETEDAPPAEAATPASFRVLLPEPGQWRIVPFGAFKQMLAPQLAHPERLRDGHRLPCHVRVFEVIAPQQVEQLAAAALGKAAPGQLQPLSAAVIAQLQLTPLLPPPPRVPRAASRSPGALLPGDRLFHLRLANDPTADEPEQPQQPQQSAERPQLASAQPLKNSIPERFAKPWEFHISREEALYDLSCNSTFLGALGGKLRRLIHFAAFRRDFRRWQVLLNGKIADEQLWGVRPPRGGLTHPFVLAWAKSAIELAGYDPRNMLTEWQIFWRRKSV